MAEKNKGIVERGAGFFEKLHYGLGAVAIAGAFIAPEKIAAPLLVFGAYEIVHGALWTFIKQLGKKKPSQQPT